jgi:hypothetical protein
MAYYAERATMRNHQIFGALVGGRGFTADKIFQTSVGNDQREQLYIELQRSLRNIGIQLHTPDVLNLQSIPINFELHVNARSVKSSPKIKRYLLHLETPLIRKLNQKESLLQTYDAVFTWRRDLLSRDKYFAIPAYPVAIPRCADLTPDRSKFSCMIASNKASRSSPGRELYSERVKTIRWFEQHQPNYFSLFGSGWDAEARAISRAAKYKSFMKRLFTDREKAVFPSWCGTISSKYQILKNYNFSFCYENATGLPGYITEKIFDSMAAGCIPIYWGDSDISSMIPSNCYILRDEFTSHETLFKYLHGLTEKDLLSFREAINDFLASDASRAYTVEQFAATVTALIHQDFFNAH